MFLVFAVSCSADLSIKLWDFQGFECVKTMHGKSSDGVCRFVGGCSRYNAVFNMIAMSPVAISEATALKTIVERSALVISEGASVQWYSVIPKSQVSPLCSTMQVSARYLGVSIQNLGMNILHSG